MISLKSAREIELMAEGGRILGDTIVHLRRAVRPGISTQDLDEMAETFIRGHTGAVPAFKGLYGFPGSVCTSINQEIVHGIPSPKRVLGRRRPPVDRRRRALRWVLYRRRGDGAGRRGG